MLSAYIQNRETLLCFTQSEISIKTEAILDSYKLIEAYFKGTAFSFLVY